MQSVTLECSQAGVGWLSWSVAKSLRAFVESVFANSRVKNVVFTIQGKQAIYSCQYTGAVSLRALQKQDDFRWELYESRMTFVESSTKAG